MNSSESKKLFPWVMLVSRLVLFAIVQVLIAVALVLSGVSDAWEESARWWVFSVIGANIVSILLLDRLYKHEGKRFLDLFRFERETIWKDLALAIGGFILAGPIAFIPMNLLGNRILGSYDHAIAMMFRPLPLWALLIGVLFPLTISFAELPTYFGYVMPRLQQQVGSGWLAWALASFFLGVQHSTLPLILDGRFFLWRGVMYLPFAFYIGLVIKVRPRLLPYLVIGHALIDFMTLSVYFMLK